jgi:uncharacterized repeat protein (TIGR03803 family)
MQTMHSVKLRCIGVVLASLAGCGGIPVATGSISGRSAPDTVLSSPGRWKETSLHSFNYADGAYNLYAGLVFDGAGNLYGTSQSGGNYGCNIRESCGVVFELTHAANGTWKEKVLHTFFSNDSLGFFPRAGLIVDANGNLYGTTSSGGPYCSGSVGCGVVFELSPNSGEWTEKVLYGFKGVTDGSGPEGALTFDAAGNLYGTTVAGGDADDGTIFELIRQTNGSWVKRTLHSLTRDEGAGPESKLVFDNAGNLYGTADFEGAYRSCGGYGCGTAFQLRPGTNGIWSLKVLHSFGKGIDGAYPVSGLSIDSAGNLFGVTDQGGPHTAALQQPCFVYGCGTVFELMRQKTGKWTERTIHDFGKGTDGNLPRGDLIRDDSGALYGTAVFGGLYGAGNAFRLIRGSDNKWEEQVLHNFGKGKDGANPYSGMIFDQAHNLYGTTAYGGSYRAGTCSKSHGCGTIFEITPEP